MINIVDDDIIDLPGPLDLYIGPKFLVSQKRYLQKLQKSA